MIEALLIAGFLLFPFGLACTANREGADACAHRSENQENEVRCREFENFQVQLLKTAQADQRARNLIRAQRAAQWESCGVGSFDACDFEAQCPKGPCDLECICTED